MGGILLGKKEITERFFLEIVLKHKEDLKNLQKNKVKAENQINQIINDFSSESNREVKAIKLKKEKNNFILLLEVV